MAGQQSGEPQPLHQPDNLFEPVDLDVGAHGRFDGRSKSGSVLLAATKRRGVVAAAVVVACLLTAALGGRRRG